MQRNIIFRGDCMEILTQIPSKSIDLIFADPPYFMQTDGELLRVEGSKFSGVREDWDKFKSYKEYDRFCEMWLGECKRVLKDDGTIWVIGSFQNIFRLGYIMQNLGFWILNDIIWHKLNPVPNFRGSRFCNAHESLIWCAKSKEARFRFNYKTMKALNGGKQEKSVWNLGICIGNERIKGDDGKKAHATQKPQALLEKIILSSSKMGDLVLDPFFGTGTTGAVAKRLGRDFLGIERDENYIEIARERIAKIKPNIDDFASGKLEIKPRKMSLRELVCDGLLDKEERFYDRGGKFIATLCGDKVCDGEEVLSIHKMAAKHLRKENFNGWNYFFIQRDGGLKSINDLRH